MFFLINQQDDGHYINVNAIYVIIQYILQWNLCNPTPEFSDILWHPTKIYGPKVFLFIKIKPEYSDILYNLTLFPGPLVRRIRQVLASCTIWHISVVPWCVGLDTGSTYYKIYLPCAREHLVIEFVDNRNTLGP